MSDDEVQTCLPYRDCSGCNQNLTEAAEGYKSREGGRSIKGGGGGGADAAN